MKELTRMSRTSGMLEKMFRSLNADLFNGEIEEPVVTVMSSPRSYGHVSVAKTWKRKDDMRHELNIAAEALDRPVENLAATMIHEMVHLLNLQRGIQDTSRGGMYHNKRFKEEAERHGLIIAHDERYGWTLTSPSDALLEYILEHGWTEIQISRSGGGWMPAKGGGDKAGEGGAQNGGEKPKKSSTRKLACPCCGQSVRATKTVNILCGDCMERMLEVL